MPAACYRLQCCKFAEGDSRILQQKIARDRVAAFRAEAAAAAAAARADKAGSASSGSGAGSVGGSSMEHELCAQLVQALKVRGHSR